jgi:hypothetical protein
MSPSHRNTRITKLPARLRALFWDYEFDDLTWEAHHDFIVDRVLTTGDFESIRWLRSRLGDENLKEWITNHHQKLSPQQLRFWEIILALPHKRVSEWLAARNENIWEKRAAR